jgi:hypothetical protein
MLTHGASPTEYICCGPWAIPTMINMDWPISKNIILRFYTTCVYNENPNSDCSDWVVVLIMQIEAI